MIVWLKREENKTREIDTKMKKKETIKILKVEV